MFRTCSISLLVLALGAADSAYLTPVMPGVIIKPIASSGDLLPAGVDATGVAVGGGVTKSVVGILDGMGWLDNGNGTFTLFANQELGATKGAVRAHGAAGSFVSRWLINQSTLAVSTLADQITTVYHYNPAGIAWATTPTAPFAAAFDRFCSADLPAATAYYNSTSGKGLPPATGRFFMNGEETSNGRAFAHAVSGAYNGQSIQLPHIGVAAWENLLACPYVQDKTVVVALDDTRPGQVYIYVGDKQVLGSANGNVTDWAQAAGLIGGTLYTVIANGQLNEQRTPDAGFVGVGAGKGTALRFGLGQVNTPANVAAYTSGAVMDARTATIGGTYFLRPEDGVWDPVNPDTFYFVTTDGFDSLKNGGNGASTTTLQRTRLWRLVFDDLANPAQGGTITMLIDGSEDPGPQMMDNMTMDRFGRIILQEDPGNAEHSAALWVYDTIQGTLQKAAKHDPSRFGDRGYGSAGVNGAKVSSVAPYDGDSSFAAVATVTGRSDEESSGVVDAQDLLGPGWFLANVQMHSITDMPQDAEVERGQLTAIYVPFIRAAGGTYQAGNLTNITYGTGSTKTVLPVRDGGLGSSMALVPGQPGQFWCLTDRGPNVTSPTVATDKLFAKPDFAPNIRRVKLNGDGTMTVLEKISFKRSDGTTPITGLPLPLGTNGSTNEGAYAVKPDGTIDITLLSDTSGLDSEGLVAAADGTFWVSDEYGPFIAHFSATGVEIERASPYAAASVSGFKLPSVLRQREANRGMEGLCMTPDGTKLVGIMQSPLANSTTTAGGIPAGSAAGSSRRMLATRIVEITIATGATRQFAYLTDTRSTAINEIVALSATKFLILERDGNFPTSSTTAVKKVYSVDISTATDIHDPADGVNGKLFTATTTGGATAGNGTMEDIIRLVGMSPTVLQATAQLAAAGITPLTKTLVVDLATYKATYNHDKVEGLAMIGSKLYVINDDDFGVTDEDADGALSSVGMPVLAKIVHGTTTTQSLGASATATKSGLQDFTQILEIDLSAIGSTVTAANSLPTITVAPTLAVLAAASATTTVLVGDIETAAASLTVSGVSSATGTATAALSGSGSSRTLTVNGIAAGSATVTVTVTDSSGASVSRPVVVTVGGGSTPAPGSAPAASSDNSSGCGSGAGAAGLIVLVLAGLGLRRTRRD